VFQNAWAFFKCVRVHVRVSVSEWVCAWRVRVRIAAEYLIHNLYHKWCVITDRACRGLCVLHV
jgi:hypothetical protein